MEYPVYDDYKSTGIKWLECIPGHWNGTTFSRILKEIKDGTHGTHERFPDGFPLLSAKNVFNDRLDISQTESTISEEEYKQITANGFPAKNDILVTCVGTIGRSYVFDQDKPQAFQRSVAFLRLESGMCPQYYKYFIESKGYQDYIASVAKVSAQSGVYMGDIAKSPVIDVPLIEQQKIAAFLDYKTQQIDQLIKKKKALIEKLNEQRIAVITQAVTKGLDKNAKMKPSGVDWLGDVPAHWDVIRFRFLLKDGYEGLKIGPFGSQLKSEELSSSGYKVYGQENIINKNFDLGSRFLEEEKFHELKVYEIQAGDLLITMMGSSGNSEIAPEGLEKGIMDSHLIRLRPNDLILTEFAKILIDEAFYVKHQLQLLGKGSIMHGLNSSVIKSLCFCVPPIEEQRDLLVFLENEVTKITEMKSLAEGVITYLKEYRTAIITAAVTGKIDVCDFKIPGQESA